MSGPTVLHVESGRHLYGGALQVTYLLEGLAGHGVRNLLVCPPGSAIAGAVAGSAEVLATPMGGDLDLALVWRLRRLIRACRPDLVHLHSRRGADLLGGLAAALAGVPCILTRRVDNPEPRAWVAAKYRLYRRVVTISEGIRRVLLAEGVPARKVVCVHSAVRLENERPVCDRGWFEAQFGLVPGAPVVGVVAQLIPRKGHRYLIAALPAILAAVPHARFLFLGQGPLRAELEAACAPFAGQVVFAGFRPDIERILPCLDVLAHPAEMEGLGVSLLQAAACAVPIVACAAGGIPEIVRADQNGILLPPRPAPEQVAAALVRLLTDPALARRMGEAGRAIVRREFSVEAMVAGNLRVYRALVS